MASASTAEPVVLIVGAHPFPYGNASANRMLTMAQTWQTAGRRVLIINDHPHNLASPRNGPPSFESIRGVEYINLSFRSGSRWQRAQRRRTLGARASRVVGELAMSCDIEFILVPSVFLTPHLHRSLAKQFPRASFVADVVERHDARQFRRRFMDRYFLLHRFTSWYAGRFADKLIVISSASPWPFQQPVTVRPASLR